MHRTLTQGQMHVTVDLLILTVRAGQLGVLLSPRPAAPCCGQLALPGRFVGLQETAEAAARRLLEEMLPVRGTWLEQLYTFSEVDRDPRGRVISVAYLVLAPWQMLEPALDGAEVTLRDYDIRSGDGGLMLEDGDGAVIPGSRLAFDHGRMIEAGIERLRGKIDYTDLAFRLLDDDQTFTLSALMTVYEAVLNRRIDRSNFRRMIRTRYEETGRIAPIERSERGARGRPAALYRWIPDDMTTPTEDRQEKTGGQ